jgi:hypothetical protein
MNSTQMMLKHSPPYSAEVENKWIYTSTSAIRVDGVDRHTCTFTPKQTGGNTQ